MTARSYAERPRRAPPTGTFGDEPSSGPPSRRESDAMKRRARGEEREFADAYEAGRDEGRQQSRPRARGDGTRRSSSRRRKPPSIAAGARQLRAPLTRQVTSGVKFAGMTLALVALYHVLETAEEQPDAIRGLIAGPAAVLRWLADPTAPIPEKGD